jgi:hypothetical protein
MSTMSKTTCSILVLWTKPKVTSIVILPSVGVSTSGVPGPTSKIVATCPSPDELARDGTHGGNAARVILCQGDALVVGVTSVRARESEPVRQLVLSRDPPA